MKLKMKRDKAERRNGAVASQKVEPAEKRQPADEHAAMANRADDLPPQYNEAVAIHHAKNDQPVENSADGRLYMHPRQPVEPGYNPEYNPNYQGPGYNEVG